MRTMWLCLLAIGGMGIMCSNGWAAAAAQASAPVKKIPVILDTDIGGDIDDTWALALLLKSPELDLKLVVSDQGDTIYRAKIIAKLLEIAKRTDVPVGIGIRQADQAGPQAAWVAGYSLDGYPGKVYQDGVAALIDTIMSAPDPITLICIGPMPNIRAALEKEPRIAERAKFVGMYGSVRVGYDGKPTPDREWNVVGDVLAARGVFTAPWPMTITPLDTCGLVRLKGDKYARIEAAQDPLTKAVVENYHIWRKAGDPNAKEPVEASSVLFDTVAIYLAMAQDLVTLEDVPLVITDEGMTRVDPQGKRVTCAVKWKDLAKFEDFLVERLTRQP
jgi:inosine-uridine nucleoside N-ribohydrolase